MLDEANKEKPAEDKKAAREMELRKEAKAIHQKDRETDIKAAERYLSDTEKIIKATEERHKKELEDFKYKIGLGYDEAKKRAEMDKGSPAFYRHATEEDIAADMSDAYREGFDAEKALLANQENEMDQLKREKEKYLKVIEGK